MTYRVREDCRLCGSRTLTKVLELPATPLANEFPTAPCPEQEKFPLYLVACGECAHVQLPVVVDPERLFRDYVYVSGTSPVFVEHFRRYAAQMMASHARAGDLVVEIGSNDGTMLRFLRDEGARVLGIEPAEKIAKSALAVGIESWPVFFTDDVARRIVEARGHARLVIANNVFAHADDLLGIVHGVKRILEPGGVFVFEVSYLPDVLSGTLFDTVYHEHLSYHAVGPLQAFFSGFGMSLVDAERVDTHGGSIRMTVRSAPYIAPSANVLSLVASEREGGLAGPYSQATAMTFAAFQSRIATRREELQRVLASAKASGKLVAGYGAPAKATTLLHAFGLEDGEFDFIVDDSPHKQGRYLPGTVIPVLPSSAIGDLKPDVIVVLAWNFAESILEKLASFREAGGVVVVPLPHVVIHGKDYAPHASA